MESSWKSQGLTWITALYSSRLLGVIKRTTWVTELKILMGQSVRTGFLKHTRDDFLILWGLVGPLLSLFMVVKARPIAFSATPQFSSISHDAGNATHEVWDKSELLMGLFVNTTQSLERSMVIERRMCRWSWYMSSWATATPRATFSSEMIMRPNWDLPENSLMNPLPFGSWGHFPSLPL